MAPAPTSSGNFTVKELFLKRFNYPISSSKPFKDSQNDKPSQDEDTGKTWGELYLKNGNYVFVYSGLQEKSPNSTFSIGPQASSIGLTILATLLVDTNSKDQNLVISLFKENSQNSFVSPGQMSEDSKMKKGLWLGCVDIFIGCKDAISESNLQLVFTQPVTIKQDGSSTSSTSSGFNIGGGISPNGPEVSASFSQNWDNSTTVNYQDFTLKDLSDYGDNLFNHQWFLTNNPTVSGDFEVSEPCNASTSDFELIDQCSFALNSSISFVVCCLKLVINFEGLEVFPKVYIDPHTSVQVAYIDLAVILNT
jgi:hypothetical protein